MFRIELKSNHTEFSDRIAKKRWDAAVAKDRKPGNNAPNDPQMHVFGARCECAGYLWAKPVDWHTYAEVVTGLPDLDDFIDIKGIEKEWHKLIVQEDDPEEWAYLLVYANHPVYEVRGWAWGWEAKKRWNWKDPKGGRPAYFSDCFHEPEELLVILRERQGKRHGPNCACWECIVRLQQEILYGRKAIHTAEGA